MSTHARSTYDAWTRIQEQRLTGIRALDGESLGVADLVAAAKYGAKPVLDKSSHIVDRVGKSVEMLQRHLDRGDLVYGELSSLCWKPQTFVG